jgi:hypothetical protein
MGSRWFADLGGELDRFNVHIAEARRATHNSASLGERPSDRQPKNSREKRVNIRRPIRADHDVVNMLGDRGRC